jgi:hypothetical protein
MLISPSVISKTSESVCLCKDLPSGRCHTPWAVPTDEEYRLSKRRSCFNPAGYVTNQRWKNDTHWFMRQRHLKSSVAVFENTHYSIKSHLQSMLDRPTTPRTCRKLIRQNLVVEIYIWYHPVMRQPIVLSCRASSRRGYTLKLMLQGPSLARTPSKALAGALALYSHGHYF